MPNLTTQCKITRWPRNKQGYGQSYINGIRKLHHRYEWEQHNGAIPIGMFVLHSCDNPSCFEITHLFLGSGQDNMSDKVSKNRQAKLKGVNNPSAVLSEDNIEEIFKMRLEGYYQKEIAKEFRMSRSMIGHILTGKSWSHTGHYEKYKGKLA